MGNIELRALKREDLEHLLYWRNSPYLRQYFREYRPLTWEQHSEWFEHLQHDRNTQMFAITYEKQLAGACGLTRIDWINRSAEISIYIGGAYIDNRYTPMALNLLMAYGFETLGLHRLWAEIWAFDSLKQNLLTQAGFDLEVTQRQAHWANGWHDALIYSKLSPAEETSQG